MKAKSHINQFVGKVPGMDCKSEWLLAEGVSDFVEQHGEHKLEVTLIVKLDEGIRPFFRALKGEEWYAFFDGAFVGYKNAELVSALKSQDPTEPGRYLLAYIPLMVFKKALDKFDIDAIGDGLIMTTSLRLSSSPPSDKWKGRLSSNLVDTKDVPPSSDTPIGMQEVPLSSAPLHELKDPPGSNKIAVDPGTVFMGIIDDGIAVANDRFRSNDGSTRVRYFWDQRERDNGNALDRLLPYGREFEGGAINEEEDAPPQDPLIPDQEEYLFYRESLSDLSNPNKSDMRLLRPVTHGTHVLDLAAGGHDDNKRPIIAVQLPPGTVADTSGITFLEQYVMSGLLYILGRASRYKIRGEDRPVPVVINFSFGTIAGPRDGTHQLERLFDEAVEKQRQDKQDVRIILPAGNSHQSRCHAEFSLHQDNPVTLNWRLQPDDHSPSWLHIWLPPELPDDVLNNPDCPADVSITSPGGEPIKLQLTKSESVKLHVEDNESQVFGLATYTVTRSEDRRGHLCITLRQTASMNTDSKQPLAPAGLWQITLTLKKQLSSINQIHAWIERDDSVIGHRRSGRQSYFDDPDYEMYNVQGRPIEDDIDSDSIVKRTGLINAIATGNNTIVVGAARADTLRPSGYSAGGPLHHTTRVSPAIGRTEQLSGVDLLAIADDSAVHSGIIASGTYSGSTAALNGTSVAAPQVARIVADDLATKSPELLSQSPVLRSIKHSILSPDSSSEPTRTGFGTVDRRINRKRRQEATELK